MTLAEVAQRAIELGGKYDGHELPDDVNEVTVRSATALAGQGLMGVARDNYGRDGSTFSYVAGFAEVEVDVETGALPTRSTTSPWVTRARSCTRGPTEVSYSAARSWAWATRSPRRPSTISTTALSLATRFYQNRPPTILDVPRNMKWDAVNLPDPETPVGARGIGEPPVAAGACAVLNALSAALGDEIFRRAPVTLDNILMALEHGQPMQEPLTAHI